MKKKLYITLGIITLVVVLIGVALAVKHFNVDEESPEASQNIYEVTEDDPIVLTGKAIPSRVKTYQYQAQLGTFLSAQVSDNQQVKQGTPLINYNPSLKRQSLVNQINLAEMGFFSCKHKLIKVAL